MANTFENPARIHYSHASVPEHIGDLQNEAKNPKLPITSKGEKDLPMQAVVFQRRHITLLNRALRDPDHPLRGAALELMQGFTRAAEREAITTTLNQAAKEYGIPQKNLS